VGANLDRFNQDIGQVNRMKAEGPERQKLFVLANIAHSLAVIADHLTEGEQS
jgi:hypothetical protein